MFWNFFVFLFNRNYPFLYFLFYDSKISILIVSSSTFHLPPSILFLTSHLISYQSPYFSPFNVIFHFSLFVLPLNNRHVLVGIEVGDG